MITVIEGRPGQGKTVYGVELIQDGLANKRTFVASNIELFFKDNDSRLKRWKYLNLRTTVSDILSLDLEYIYKTLKCDRILLVIDECQTIMNSRRWLEMPPEFEYFLQQHRHYRFDMVGLTQSIKRADVVMRELVQRFYRIYKVLVLPIPFLGVLGFFLRFEYDPDSIESQTRNYENIGWFGLLPAPIIITAHAFKLYDTYQKYPTFAQDGRREVVEYLYEKELKVKRRVLNRRFIEELRGSELSTGEGLPAPVDTGTV